MIDTSALQLLLTLVTEYVEHDHAEQNQQGLDNRLIKGTPAADAARPVRRRSRMGGLLNYYERAA